jgi:hypothetical protein
MRQKAFVLFCLISASLHASGPIDQMNEEEKKACGIEKLSTEEKGELDKWVTKQITVVAPLVEKGKIVHGTFKITEVKNLGHFVVLDNGFSYDIFSRSRKKTMAWKVGDEVELAEPIKRKSFKIKNISRKQTVAAKEPL